MFASARFSLITISTALAFSLSATAQILPKQTGDQLYSSTSTWFQEGVDVIEQASRKTLNNKRGAARNIILFLGDGMGPSTVTAARIYAGQQQGMSGEEYQLSFEKMPWAGLVKTYNTDAQVPDSAGTMTAIMTGVKTRAGVIGIDGRPLRNSCASYLETPGATLISALELAEIAGKETGIVSTARLTHATPAATFANAPDRNWEGSQNLPEEARVLGCEDIASQLISLPGRLQEKFGGARTRTDLDGIDVALGGGRSYFFGEDPASLAGFAEAPGEGRRDDGRNLIREWQDNGGIYVMDKNGFDALSADDNRNVLGLFEPSHMRYEANRSEDTGGEPSLTDMTLKAIDLLNNHEKGFFLMVEAGRIDHAHHVNNAFNALNEATELSRAVQTAMNAVDLNETLIIVTADHSHVMTMAGYPTRGNPILGVVLGNDGNGNPQDNPNLDSNALPYTTLSYATGAGYDDNGQETNADLRSGPPATGRHDLRSVDTTAPGYHQETLVDVPETHGGEDVGIYAIGPGSHLVSGVIEQNVIFHIMNYAGDLENQAREAIE